MRRVFFVILLLSGSIFCLFSQNYAWSKVLISEIRVAGVSSTDEFAEFYNNSSSSSSLAGWRLTKETATGRSYDLVTAFGDVFLKPFGYFLIAHRDFSLSTIPDVTYYNESCSYCSLSNNNKLLLYDNSSNLIDMVSWGEISANKSLIRLPDDQNGNGTDTDNDDADFILKDSDPQNSSILSRPAWPPEDSDDDDEANSAPENISTTNTSTIWTQIIINEVMINPGEGEEEWVELYNAATSSLDLTGGVLCDSRVGDCQIAAPTSTIPALGYVVVVWNGSKLNNDNDGDKVILKNPAGEIIDQLQYGKGALSVPDRGQALARNPNRDWVITTTPTPGAENNIQTPPVSVINQNSVTSGGGTVAPANNNEETKSKTTKTTTSTPKAKVDTVKIVWRVKAPIQGTPGENLLLDASESADPRGGSLEFLWNFGDGGVGMGNIISHQYTTSGVYTVVVYATSTANTIGQKKMTIRVDAGLSVRNTGIKISEVLANPTGADKKEFVKLYNNSSSTIDLSGWKLSYKDSEYVLPDKTKIESQSFLTFFQAVTHFYLDNSGGKMELLTPDDVVADIVNFGKAVEGQSFVVSSTPPIIGLNTEIKSTSKKTVSSPGGKNIYAGLVSLADVRTLNKNTGVKIQGVVEVVPGVFGTQYFYITADGLGLQIYQNKKQFPALQIGDLVAVRGTISTPGVIKRVNVKNKADINVLATNQMVSSTPVALEDLDEDILGGLVQISGEITEIKSNFMYVDDGTTEAVVYFKRGAKVDKAKFKVGDLVAINGVVEQSKTGLEVWPRGPEDIRVTGESEDLLKQEALTKKDASASDTASKYLTATAGGITTLLLGFFAKSRGAGAKIIAQRGISLVVGLIRKKKDNVV